MKHVFSNTVLLEPDSFSFFLLSSPPLFPFSFPSPFLPILCFLFSLLLLCYLFTKAKVQGGGCIRKTEKLPHQWPLGNWKSLRSKTSKLLKALVYSVLTWPCRQSWPAFPSHFLDGHCLCSHLRGWPFLPPFIPKIIVLLRYNSLTLTFTLLKCILHWFLVYPKSCATISTT